MRKIEIGIGIRIGMKIGRGIGMEIEKEIGIKITFLCKIQKKKKVFHYVH